MLSIYKYLKEEKLKKLLLLSCSNLDFIFTKHLLEAIEITDRIEFNILFEWLFLYSLDRDNETIFGFLYEEFYLDISKYFVNHPNVNLTQKIMPHPILYCLEYNKNNILKYVFTSGDEIFQISCLFTTIIEHCLTYEKYVILSDIMNYYYKHKNNILMDHDTLYQYNCKLLKISFHYMVYDLFNVINTNENIVNDYLPSLKYLFIKNDQFSIKFMDMLNILLWEKDQVYFFYDQLMYYDNYILLEWYLQIEDLDTFITEDYLVKLFHLLIHYDSWKSLNTILNTKYSDKLMDTMEKDFIRLIVNTNDYHKNKGYHVFNYIVKHCDINLYESIDDPDNNDNKAMSLLEYTMKYDKLEIAYIFLTIENRKDFTIHKKYIHLYIKNIYIYPFLKLNEVRTLLDYTNGYIYDLLPEFIQGSIDYSKFSKKITYRKNEDVCIVCRELKDDYVLCTNDKKQHNVCNDCFFKLDTMSCCLCRKFDFSIDDFYHNF